MHVRQVKLRKQWWTASPKDQTLVCGGGWAVLVSHSRTQMDSTHQSPFWSMRGGCLQRAEPGHGTRRLGWSGLAVSLPTGTWASHFTYQPVSRGPGGPPKVLTFEESSGVNHALWFCRKMFKKQSSFLLIHRGISPQSSVWLQPALWHIWIHSQLDLLRNITTGSLIISNYYL